MWYPKKMIPAVVLAVVAMGGGPAWAVDEGQEDLDRATEAKLIAKTLTDLAEVVNLLDSALKKGLSQDDRQFAKTLLGSTLIQRGSAVATATFRTASRGGRWAEMRRLALSDLEKGVTHTPEMPEALYLIARLNLLPGGDKERASEALDMVLDVSEDAPDVRARALTLRATIEKDPDKQLADLDEAVKIAPGDLAALRTRGFVLAGQEKFDKALADLNKAIEQDAKHSGTYELKAVVLAQMEKYDEALVCLDQLHEMNPGSAVPLAQKARIHIRQENLDAALHELNRAVDIDPKNLSVLLLRAGVFDEMGNNDEALADVDKMLELKSDLIEAVRFRAVLLAKAEKLDEAIAALEKIRRAHPGDVTTLLQLGMLYNANKTPQRAIEAYSAVLDKKPDHWAALRGRGDSLLNSGKHRRAIADYEKAFALQPKDPGILNNLAWVLATSPDDELRDGARAVELATVACEETEFKQAHILSTMGAAYAETGDFKAAVEWVEKGLAVAEQEQIEPLTKELESYRKEKPWREQLSEGKPAEDE